MVYNYVTRGGKKFVNTAHTKKCDQFDYACYLEHYVIFGSSLYAP